MILKQASTICSDVSRYDTYYYYPVVYYVKTDEVNPLVSDVPIQGSIKVEAYCVNLGDAKLVVHNLVDRGDVVVEAIDRDGNSVAPVSAVNTLYEILAGSRIPTSFSPHEAKAASLLFMVDEQYVSSLLKYHRYVSKLEDRFVAIVGETIYVFSRNPNTVFLRIDDPEAVPIAMEKSIVSRTPIRDMREHVKSFISGDSVTVFVGSKVSLWCDQEKCLVVRTPSNVTRLMLRDIHLYVVEVNVMSPKKYRSTKLVLPTDYIVVSRNVMLLNKLNTKFKVVKIIENVNFPTPVPLLFSKKGFAGYAHVAISKDIAHVKIVKSISGMRREHDVEEDERLITVL